MAMSFAFLLVVFAALCGMVMIIAVMVVIFRAAARSNGQPNQGGSSDTVNPAVPPVLGDNGLTNPAYPFHHSSPSLDEVTRHHSAAASASIPSFDSGPASSPAPDSGSSSPSVDGGSSCG